MINQKSKNTVQVSIKGFKTFGLIESGADISICGRNLLEEANISLNKMEKPEQFFNFTGIGGNIHSIIGQIKLSISFNRFSLEQLIYVTDNSNIPLVLGNDFLSNHRCCIDSANNELHVHDGLMSVALTENESKLAKVRYTALIDKQSEAIIEVKVPKACNNKVVLLEPLPSLPSVKLVGAKCLTKVKKNKACMKVMNPTNSEITLPTDQKIAAICQIEAAIPFPSPGEVKEMKSPSGDEQIMFDIDNSDLSPEQTAQLLAFLEANKDVFSTDYHNLGQSNLHMHRTDTGEARPIRQRFYRRTAEKRAETKRQVKELLEADLIKESDSAWTSPVVLCRKKSGEFRMACDYRKIKCSNQTNTISIA